MANFFKCADDCGDVLLEMSPCKKDCTAKDLAPLAANSTDAATEKHVPVVTLENGKVKVQVGSVPHPMLEEHHIEWIYIQTTFGGIYCNLAVGDPPEALFDIAPEEVEEVYEYCNLHGLWRAPTPVFPNTFDTNNVACSPEFTSGCVNPSGT